MGNGLAEYVANEFGLDPISVIVAFEKFERPEEDLEHFIDLDIYKRPCMNVLSKYKCTAIIKNGGMCGVRIRQPGETLCSKHRRN